MTTTQCDPTPAPTDLVIAILHEVLSKLRDLVATGHATSIDLRRLPLTDVDSIRLRAILGQGEVHAEFDALGVSKISETRIAGVWLTTHANAAGDTIGQMIDIAFVPEILAASPSEVSSAANALAATLTEFRPPPT